MKRIQIIKKPKAHTKQTDNFLNKPNAVDDGFDILLDPDREDSLCRYNLGVVEEVQPNGGGHTRAQIADKDNIWAYQGSEVESDHRVKDH